MGRRWMPALLLLLLPALLLPARALTGEEALRRQEDALDLDGLWRAAEQNGGTAEYGASLEEGLDALPAWLDQRQQEINARPNRTLEENIARKAQQQ